MNTEVGQTLLIYGSVLNRFFAPSGVIHGHFSSIANHPPRHLAASLSLVVLGLSLDNLQTHIEAVIYNNDDDIRMKPNIGTQCPTQVARVLVCATRQTARGGGAYS